MREQLVTTEDVRELFDSRCMEPCLVRWLDDGTVEVTSKVLFSDISWSERRRPHKIIITLADLNSIGDHDIENPADEDCEAYAEMLNS